MVQIWYSEKGFTYCYEKMVYSDLSRWSSERKVKRANDSLIFVCVTLFRKCDNNFWVKRPRNRNYIFYVIIALPYEDIEEVSDLSQLTSKKQHSLFILIEGRVTKSKEKSLHVNKINTRISREVHSVFEWEIVFLIVQILLLSISTNTFKVY